MQTANEIFSVDSFLSPASFWFPEALVESAWHQHAPFAFWLMEVLRPRTFLELGTHHGFSYLAFCQAAKQVGVGTGYAVDTWSGDAHVGAYDDTVYSQLRELHDPRYAGFSRLVRSTFDDALPHFTEKSIDLLHIDGCHFYDDVRHDFESWKSKLSDRAVVLFHDTNVREHGFGVFKLWEELQQHRYPAFEFLHGHGLGVLGVDANLPEPLKHLFTAAADPVLATRIREIYARLGSAIEGRYLLAQQETALRAREDELARLHDQSEAAQRGLLEQQCNAEEQSRQTANLQAELNSTRKASEAVARELTAARMVEEQQKQDIERFAAEHKRAEEANERLAQQLAAAELLVGDLQKRSTSSRWLLRKVAGKAIHAPRDISRRMRRSRRLRAIAHHPFSRQLRHDYHQQLQTFEPGLSVYQDSVSALAASPPYFLKATSPKSIRNIPNWLLYRLLRSLAAQSWIFSERRMYKFRRSANKRSAKISGLSASVATSVARQDGPHPIGFRAEILINLEPLDKKVADFLYRRPKQSPTNRSNALNVLKSAIHASNKAVTLALSHDNYRKSVGGVQLCLLMEEAAFVGRGITYIHLCPAQPLPTLAGQDSRLSFDYAVTINGSWLGEISAVDLIAVLDAETHRGGRRFCVAVHSLLGHSPEVTAELYRACKADEAYFWLHDYFSLCVDYTLLRNSVSACGAPPAESAGCRICHVGEQRKGHLERLKFLFSQVPFTVVAPSEISLSLWHGATTLPYRKALVHEHCEIRQVMEPIDTPLAGDATASQLNVAYLGAPIFHKGWSLFSEIVRDLQGTGDFTFHHLGKSKSQDYPPDLAFTPVSVLPEDWNAMSAAVRLKKIDIAVLCSLWPETYNFTAVEAITGGALIVTLESSGNIAAIVRAYDCGFVFKNEMDLRRAFADGSIARETRNRRQGERSRYHVTRRHMTADLFSVESLVTHDY